MSPMRDSLFGEEILWQGAPREASIATPYKIAAIVSAIVAVVGVAFAVAIVSTDAGPLNVDSAELEPSKCIVAEWHN